MACCWLVPLVISVLGRVCSCEYINVTVSDTRVPWRNANRTSGCKLAGLDRSGKLNPTDIRVLNHTEPLDAWIGAQVKLSPWINITGCFHHDNSSISSIEDNGVDISNVRCPVEACFGHCSSDEFAITGTRCYCLYNATTTSGNPCLGHVCGQRNNSLCGYTNCLCRYKPFNPDQCFNNVGGCMTVRKVNNRFHFVPKDCTSNHTFVCSNTSQNMLTVYGDNQYGKWTNALSRCNHNKQLLSGLNIAYIQNSTNRMLQDNISYWVGIYKVQNFNFGYSNDDNNQCIALHVGSNHMLPELGLRNCSSKLPVLCEQVDDFISTTQTGHRAVTSSNPEFHTPLNNFTSSSCAPSFPQYSAGLSSVSTTDVLPDGADTGSSSAVLLPPIIGTASGLVIIGLITSVVCLVKRRKRQNERQKHTESHHGEQLAIDAHSPRYVDIDAHHNTSYSELSKNKDDPTQAQDDYTYNHLYTADRENERAYDSYHHTADFRSEYDSLEKFNQGKNDQTNSEYDHFKANSKFSCSTDTGNYDTMEVLKKGQSSVAIDDTYDHM